MSSDITSIVLNLPLAYYHSWHKLDKVQPEEPLTAKWPLQYVLEFQSWLLKHDYIWHTEHVLLHIRYFLLHSGLFCCTPDVFQPKATLWSSNSVKGWLSHGFLIVTRLTAWLRYLVTICFWAAKIHTTITGPWVSNHDWNSYTQRLFCLQIPLKIMQLFKFIRWLFPAKAPCDLYLFRNSQLYFINVIRLTKITVV